MATPNSSSTLGQWVSRYPQTAGVFENVGIDYCCHGGRSLESACDSARIDPASLLRCLEREIAAAESVEQIDWSNATLTEMCDHIEQTHHAYLRKALPRLSALVRKVAGRHSADHPELLHLELVFSDLRAGFEPHLLREEQLLFPAIRLLESSTIPPQFSFGSFGNPIHILKAEHTQTAEALRRIRDLTEGFRVPEYAGNTSRVMLQELRLLEHDTHQHIHKENNMLFPRASCMEICTSSL